MIFLLQIESLPDWCIDKFNNKKPVNCFAVGSSDLQKIKKTVDNLYTEKQKLEKEKSKKGSKGKTKVTLRIETDDVST